MARRTWANAARCAAATAASAVIIWAILSAQPATNPDSAGSSVQAQTVQPAPQQNSVPDIAARVRPGVVQVVTTVMREDAPGRQASEQGYGSGSGVYIDARGYFVTNKHVIDGGDHVYIVTLGGTTYPAEVRGSDDGTDLAVLYVADEIDAEPVAMGDSDALRVGEAVIAIGNPGVGDGSVLFGTLTTGVVSALDRTKLSAGNFTRVVSVIQTDAAINSGNSGGALLNAAGELIGIPTLKMMYDTGSVYEGLGFAIPINTARPVIEEIIEKGRVARPILGIGAVATAGGDALTQDGIPAGIQAVTVDREGAAWEAGLRPYDIITHVDSVRVRTVQELTAVLDVHTEGEFARLTVARCFREDGRPLSAPHTFVADVPVRFAS